MSADVATKLHALQLEACDPTHESDEAAAEIIKEFKSTFVKLGLACRMSLLVAKPLELLKAITAALRDVQVNPLVHRFRLIEAVGRRIRETVDMTPLLFLWNSDYMFEFPECDDPISSVRILVSCIETGESFIGVWHA